MIWYGSTINSHFVWNERFRQEKSVTPAWVVGYMVNKHYSSDYGPTQCLKLRPFNFRNNFVSYISRLWSFLSRNVTKEICNMRPTCYVTVTTLSGVGCLHNPRLGSVVTNLFVISWPLSKCSTVTVGVDVYDTRCDRVSYDPLTHSRHNGEV